MAGTTQDVGQREHSPTAEAVGGQAVLGGVMMRKGERWALALRLDDDTIDVSVHETPGWAGRVSTIPFARGIAALAETLVLGGSATVRSSRARRGEDLDTGVGAAEVLSIVLGVVFAIVTFGIAPTAVAHLVGATGLAFHLLEATLRITVLVGYLAALGRSAAIADVWAYHGAEHQVVNAFEAGDDLTVAAAGRQTVRHGRCGTTFLLLVALLAIAVHVVIGEPSLPVLLASRVLGLPVIAALAYEVIRVAGRPDGPRVLRPLLAPGLAVQRLTTRPPDDRHREVALAAMVAVVAAPAAVTAEPVGVAA